MSPNLPRSLHGAAWGSLGLAPVVAGQQRALLARNTGRCSIRLGIDRHALDLRNNLHRVGMDCWRPHCSSHCVAISFIIQPVTIQSVLTIHHSIHRLLDGGLVQRSLLHADRSILGLARPGSRNPCLPVDAGRSRHRNDPAVGVPT